MKTQTLYKRLSLPLLLTVISATGIGVTPARSASLLGSQNTVINANPESTLIAQRHQCPANPPPSDPCWGEISNVTFPTDAEQSPSINPTGDSIEKPVIEKPVIDKPVIEKPVIDKPVIDKPVIENRPRYRHHRLPQQQPTREPLPTLEPSPQNNNQQ